MVTSLTAFEAALITDAKVLLTKNIIIAKVYELFGAVAQEYQLKLTHSPMIALAVVQAKISRGENYRGLPYVILDYPRIFSKENTCAIRTLFWWGNFFSITLQLSGSYLQRYESALVLGLQQERFGGWSLGCGKDPWEHHFGTDNYNTILPGLKYPLHDLPYVKLAKKIPLEKWDDAQLFFKENFSFLIDLLATQAPIR